MLEHLELDLNTSLPSSLHYFLLEMPVPVLQYHLPDTLAQWPYPATLNPHHWEVKAASDAWLASFNAFDPKAQNSFIRCDFGQ